MEWVVRALLKILEVCLEKVSEEELRALSAFENFVVQWREHERDSDYIARNAEIDLSAVRALAFRELTRRRSR